jgi:hypothetical protein
MVKNKTIFFMLFCLSTANIIHFHNYLISKALKIIYLNVFLVIFYEFNILETKKGVQLPEHLFKRFFIVLLIQHFPQFIFQIC